MFSFNLCDATWFRQPESRLRSRETTAKWERVRGFKAFKKRFVIHSLTSHLLPHFYFFFFFFWVSNVMEETRYKFPGNVNLICFGLRLFMQSENKQWQFQKCRQFAAIVLLKKFGRSHSFARVKFLARYNNAQSFCRCVPSHSVRTCEEG